MARINYREMSSGITKDDLVKPDVEVIPEAPATTVVEEPKPKIATGTVINCLRLNVRETTDINSRSLWVLPADSKVTVYLNKSTEEWVNVRTASGVVGFCVREYIFINS